MIAPSRPLSGLQPATHTVAGFRYAVLQAAPASTKHTSATAPLRSPFPFARRPRSRLGIPARLEPIPYRHPSLRSDVDLLSRCLRYHLPPA